MSEKNKITVGDRNAGIARKSKFSFSESDIETLFASVFTGILILEPLFSTDNQIIDFTWVFCNRRAETLLGQELVTRRLSETSIQAFTGGRFELYKEIFISGVSREIEFDLLMDQKMVRAKVTAFKMGSHLLLSVRDISSQIALNESEIKYRLMAGSIPHILYTSNLEGHIEYSNETWFDGEELPEPLPVEFIIDRFIHPEDQALAYESWNEILKEEKELKYDNRIIGRDGTYRWFQNRVVAMRDEAGKIVKWFGTGTDIHDEKTAMDELAQTKSDLEGKNLKLSRLNEDLDTFVYTASHDLTAPIANISGLTELLHVELGSLLKEGQKQYLAMMQESIAKLQATIFDLTRMILVDAEQDTNRLAVDLADVVADITSELGKLIRESSAIITTDFELKQVLFARKNLRSVLYNLILNALKYRSNERKLLVHVSSRQVESEWCLSVSDTGLGIPEQQIPKIFGIYHRLNPDIDGNGYGLYMIKRMVENNGGRIEVQSTLGTGSQFLVYLPLR